MPIAALLALLGSGLGQAQPANPSQGDTETQRLIDRLNPTRGIRMPSAESPAPSVPSLTPAAPDASAQVAPAGDPPAAPPVVAATPPPPPTRETTAPAGVAAVSLTVNFATGSATLTPQAATALAALGRALSSAELAPYRFRIEGHTDTVGDAGANMILSQRRAESVRAFLIKRFAVQPGRLVAAGMGESQLLVPTADGVPEPSNRRVQVLNLGG
jgi:outer membrane protein OmpA-like peptidoglycan-associated protein